MVAFAGKRKWIVLLALLAIVFTVSLVLLHQKPVDYISQVKPIFNKKCITCHGGVRRKGGFSVLFRSEALAKTESGKLAIIPGDPEHSEMIRRITNRDPEERMPYKHEPLTADEISILRRWIKEGAVWGDHWAYLPVKAVAKPVPAGALFGLIPAKKLDWANNDIDYFIYDKLKQEKLKPATQADKTVLLRRVSLDLTGVPAPEKWASAFLKNNKENAYEELVDSLLSSPQYGERWAALWMDLARYADTKGYERDDSRSIWRYRDWLIHAFNADEPYDQFIRDQIAGDLMTNPTDAQYIATAFHRNTMTNDEGGTENEEFRTAAVLDRVNTTWEALMGTTFGCVQCHSHPYDPFTHDEYYQFMAFFNDTRDEDSYADYPLLRHFKSTDSLHLKKLTDWVTKDESPKRASDMRTFLRTWQPSINSLTADQFVNSELADTKWLIFRNHAVARLKKVDLNNRDFLIYRYAGFLKGGVWTIHLDREDGPVLKTISVLPTKDWAIANTSFTTVAGVHDLYLTYSNPNLKKPNDNGMQFDWFYFTNEFPGKGKPGYDTAKKYFDTLLNADLPTTPIMMDNPADMHRASNVFERGNWLVKGKEVQPGVPHALNPLPAGAPANRLGLALWLTSDQNPLTARTIVNRLWEQLFGTGLVETLEDFGTQGIPPTHRELLDDLSWKLMHEYQWSLKRLLREMLLSATYKQDSRISPGLLEKDPYNKFYARGSRVRLSAEEVRDQALAISGMMSKKMYGPSVMPYQPGGIWLSPWNGQDWVASAGEDRNRRALYTYWKRTAPYPSMISFDGAAREVCTARRIRTNTPLQALVTLNDETYLDAARHFAYRMQEEGTGQDVKKQIARGYQLALYRDISPEKLEVFEKLYREAYDNFKNDKEKTCEMIGEMNEHNNPETAALVVVANAMMNMDELITKN
jgi:mono/diheme cytochrome c family protein